MAQAEKKPRGGYDIVLTLSPDEAEALLVLTGNVCDETGSIYNALKHVVFDTGKFQFECNVSQFPRVRLRNA